MESQDSHHYLGRQERLDKDADLSTRDQHSPLSFHAGLKDERPGEEQVPGVLLLTKA